MRKLKETTHTKLVFDCLLEADDLLTTREIMARTRQELRHVSSSLWMLRKYHAVDCIEGEDQLWWFAQPKEDQRQRIVKERTPETKPRKAKRPRVRKMIGPFADIDIET